MTPPAADRAGGRLEGEARLGRRRSRRLRGLRLLLAGLLAAALGAGVAGASDPTFTLGPFPSAGTGPVAVAAGDLNRDGKPDLAVTNDVSHDVTILLGDGAGNFAAAAGSPILVTGFPRALAAGDLNRDGRLDLAAAHYFGDTVSVLLGNGSGGFTAASGSPFAVPGDGPAAIAVADVNGDGRLDLVTANQFSSDVSILLGNGAGGFSPAPGTPPAVGTGPFGIAAADLNRDGKVDLAVANFTAESVSVLLGDGAGGFSLAAGSPIALTHPWAIAVADVNRDGKADLAVTDGYANGAYVLLGNGAGGFSVTPDSPIYVGLTSRAATAADLNGDGKPDLVVSSGGAGDLSLLVGDGAGGFVDAAGTPQGVGTEPRGVTAADFDRDGKPDLAVAIFNYDNLTILRNTTPFPAGSAFFPAPGSPAGAGSDPRAVAAADLNRDGRLDLAVANRSSHNVSVLLGNGAGGFGPASGSPFFSGGFPVSVAVADVNRDGSLDLAVANSGEDDVAVLLGNGAGAFSAAPTSPVSAGTTPRAVAAADLNRDGRTDLAVANGDSNDVSVLLDDGAGGFTPASGSPLAAGMAPSALAVPDVNRDGRPDLAVANADSDDVSVFLGTGSGGFVAAGGSPVAVHAGPSAVTSTDVNRDGRPDLVVGNERSDDVSVLLGNGTGAFIEAPGSPVPAGDAPLSVSVGDLDRDGIPDLAVADRGSNKVSVLLGHGTGGFGAAPGSPFAAGIAPASIVSADLDRDGRLDLAVANGGSNNVSILLRSSPPTAVVLRHFRARWTGHGVELRWRTVGEAGLLGFEVYRSRSKVNRVLVAARGAATGASYRLIDRAVRAERAFVYELEAVHADGTRSRIGRARLRRP
jgi:hypothetical protein